MPKLNDLQKQSIFDVATLTQEEGISSSRAAFLDKILLVVGFATDTIEKVLLSNADWKKILEETYPRQARNRANKDVVFAVFDVAQETGMPAAQLFRDRNIKLASSQIANWRKKWVAERKGCTPPKKNVPAGTMVDGSVLVGKICDDLKTLFETTIDRTSTQHFNVSHDLLITHLRKVSDVIKGIAHDAALMVDHETILPTVIQQIAEAEANLLVLMEAREIAQRKRQEAGNYGWLPTL